MAGWQAADPGTVAQDEQGTYHVKVGESWVPAPKGTIAQDEKGAFHVNTDALQPPAKAAPAESSGLGTELLNTGKDIAGSVAHGAGTAYGAVKNIVSGTAEDPMATGERWAAPFQHAPGAAPQDVGQNEAQNFPTPHPPTGLAGLPGGPGGIKVGDIAQHVAETPEGRLVGDVVKPAADIAQAVGTVAGVGSAAKGLTRGLDTAFNAINPNTEAQAARVGANKQLIQARADGFKATPNDVRSGTNPADTSRPNADLTGPASSTPDVVDKINTHNQTLATQRMAADVKLSNTRNIDPAEVSARMAEEGKVYGQVGDAIGTTNKPTAALDHELATAGARSADPEIQAKIQKQVQFYRDHFQADTFNGPDAVQTVRTLREAAQDESKSTVPSDKIMGRTHQALADAIENEMMRQLPSNQADLRQAFPQARQQLAKLYELDEVSGGGQVNPAKVLQLKNDGKPLTGAAASVANAAEVLPESMGQPGGTPTVLGQHEAPTHTGVIRGVSNIARRVTHVLPGNDPTTEAYQASHYGPTGGENVTPPAPTAPPIGRAPPATLTQPAGEAGRAPIQGELPLERATWDQAALDRIQGYKGETIKPEATFVRTGAPLDVNAMRRPGTEVKVPREPSPAQRLRKKLGEAMQ